MSDEKIVIEPDEDELIDLEDDVAHKNTIRIITFSLGQENYCASLDQVKEVMHPSGITRIPNSPDFIVGVINLRGEITAVLDIRHFFGLGTPDKSAEARIIITDVTGSCVGIMVDKVNYVVEIEQESIQPTLATLKGNLAEYTKGEVQMNGDILVLLDLKKVLNNEAISSLRKGESR